MNKVYHVVKVGEASPVKINLKISAMLHFWIYQHEVGPWLTYKRMKQLCDLLSIFAIGDHSYDIFLFSKKVCE